MKAFDIALRDMLRSTRSAFALMFMFVVPLMVVGLLQFIVGGGGGGDDVMQIPATDVLIVNLDQPAGAEAAHADAAADEHDGQAFSVGHMLVEMLESDDFTGLLNVGSAPGEAEARAAVDAGEAGIAVIIPPGLTHAVVTQGEDATIALYSDPTLTIGPGIVKGIITRFIDSFSGAKIAVQTAADSLQAEGLAMSPAAMQEVGTRYVDWASSGAGAEAAVRVQPVGSAAPAGNGTGVLGGITAAMMVFYVFFTGSATAQSIIREEEEGTLRRLFTTPVDIPTIMTGKILASLLTLVVQIVSLLIASTLLFKINWGRPVPVLLAATGLVLMSASFGLLIMSLTKNSNQVGVIYGGVLTITGMVGVFTGFIPNTPQSFNTVALFVPQGWAMRAWMHVMRGGGLTAGLLVPFGVAMALSAVFFVVGMTLFRRRFA